MKWLRRALRVLPLAVLLVVAIAVALLLLGRMERTIEARGEIRVERYQIVRPAVSGIISEVLAAPGDRVQAGQTVARLRDAELWRQQTVVRQELREAQARLAGLRRERELLEMQRHPLELEQQRREVERGQVEAALGSSQVREREIRLRAAVRAFERAEELHRAGLLSKQNLEDARFDRLELQQQLEGSRLERELAVSRRSALEGALRLLVVEQRQVLARTDREISELEERIQRWAEELKQLEGLTAAHELTAEMTGIVLGAPVNDLVGRRVEAGEELFDIIDTEQIFFVTEVPEETIVRVRSGQTAQVEITGLPKRRFDVFWGRVGKVSQNPTPVTAVGSRILYPVEIRLREPWVELAEGRFYLRNGMRGQAKIAYQHNVPFVRVLYDVLVGEQRRPDQRTVHRREAPTDSHGVDEIAVR